MNVERCAAKSRGFVLFVCALCVAVSAPMCVAQEAADPNTLEGNIDLQESGVIAQGAEASSGVLGDAVSAMEQEAERDLEIVKKPQQKPTFFIPQPTAAARPSAMPTLNASNSSIESDIEELRQEAHELDQPARANR